MKFRKEEDPASDSPTSPSSGPHGHLPHCLTKKRPRCQRPWGTRGPREKRRHLASWKLLAATAPSAVLLLVQGQQGDSASNSRGHPLPPTPSVLPAPHHYVSQDWKMESSQSCAQRWLSSFFHFLSWESTGKNRQSIPTTHHALPSLPLSRFIIHHIQATCCLGST